MRFTTAVESGTVVEQSGYHQPGGGYHHNPDCGCKLTTDKGAYRDVTVNVDDKIIHYYHQSPVVTNLSDGGYKIDSCGYRTMTTKQRINRHIPEGYYVRQKDWDWWLEKPDGSTERFEDGMVING